MGVVDERTSSMWLLWEATTMTLTAFLHGYPPGWSMGGEVSTHRTLRTVPGSVVFTYTPQSYDLDGVQVRPIGGGTYQTMIDDAGSVGATILFAHSTLSQNTVRAARRMKIPTILAVHAPPRFAADLRRAWTGATVRLYNTEAARKEWRDVGGWVLHPPVGRPEKVGWTRLGGPNDALTLTSSLQNKGVKKVMDLARRWPDRRFIIVRSPAHQTHGAVDFEDEVALIPNIEVWDRLHPDEMSRLWAETKVLLVPSRYETYGLSALEAAWHDIPSVHVDTVHVREGIGTAAKLLQSHSVDELEAAVREVEEDYDRWADAARTRVEELEMREQEELAGFVRGVTGLAAGPRLQAF